jgi:hypothetical protein
MLEYTTSKEVYVDIAGHDEGPGSKATPFRTIHRALDWVADLRADGANADVSLIVDLLPGRHRIDRSLMFGPEHSGSLQAPTILRGHDGAIISGVSEAIPTAPADAICRRNPALSAFQIPETGPPPEIGDFGFSRAVAPAPPFVLTEACFLRGARLPERGWFTAKQIRLEKDGRTLALTLDAETFRRIEGEPSLWIECILTAEWDWHVARVLSVDAETGRVVFALPHQAAPVSDFPARFAFQNMRAGLSRPGTTWLDPANSQIVVHPPADNKIELCLMQGHLARLHDTRHIVFDGLAFRGGLANAIHGTGCEDVTIVRCSADKFASGGIHVEGRRIRIVDSVVEDIGTTALRMQSGKPDSLVGGDSLVQACKFARWGWRKPIYESAVKLIGVGTTVRDCAFSDAPHLAIEMSGNDHLVEGCTFERVVTEIDDMGAIYVNSGENPLERGHLVRWNLFRDIGLQRTIASAVYLDRASSGISVSENIFHRITSECGSFVRAVHINGGRDIDICGNLFIDCDCSVEFDFYLNTWGIIDVPTMEAGLATAITKLASSPHLERYPELAELATQSLLQPTSNRIIGNVTVLGSERARSISVSGGPSQLIEQYGNEVAEPTDTALPPNGLWTRLFASSNRGRLAVDIERLAGTWSVSTLSGGGSEG